METTDQSPQTLEDVNFFFRDLPRWNYKPEANFFSALCFMRRRLLAMDMVQLRVQNFLKDQQASPIAPLRDSLKELSARSGNPEYRSIYEGIQETLHSRLLRSRTDARDLTSDALEKIRNQVIELYQRSEFDKERELSREGKMSRVEKENSVLIKKLINQVEDLTQLFKAQDYLYERYESGRSILNAFKQQRSYVSEILDFYEIPDRPTDLDQAEKENGYPVKILSNNSNSNLLAESSEDVYSLSASDPQRLAIALKQGYWFFHLTKKNMSPSFKQVIDILESGELQNIGTKGHEWQAFAASTFGIDNSIFETTRKLDTQGRKLEWKIFDHLTSLSNRLKESKSDIEVILMPNSMGLESPDIMLKPERIAFEIQLEPVDGVFQRITYTMPVDFQEVMQELSVSLSIDIHNKFKTKNFKIFVELDNGAEIKMVIDFLTLGDNVTEIHKFVLEAIKKLSVEFEVKSRKKEIDSA